jgi:cyclophilin family peptidyl-prolyl cis-trans isomerase
MNIRKRVRKATLGFVSLEERLVMAAPVLDPLAAATLPAGKTLMIPLTATDADGDALTYTVSGDNGQILATVKTGQPFLKFSIAGYGDMVFQLFDDIAPVTVDKITGLVQSGYYDGLTIHRIVPDFVIQGGDPEGDGSGGPGFEFDDEFSLEAIFSGVGQLAMANSGKDTNGSQFFVTQGQARFLDFNHTIYGQLVRGFEVLTALNTATAPITITSASMVTDVTDAVLQLKAPGLGTTSFTVTVTDTNGEFDSNTFQAIASADTANDPPILGPVTGRTTVAGQSFEIALSSIDYENDAVIYEALVLGSSANATVSVNGNIVTVTPKAGFSGKFDLRLAVRQQGATDRGSTADPRDYQTVEITVLNPFETETFQVTTSESTPIDQALLLSFAPNFAVAGSTYTASIAWGDQTTSDGTIVIGENGKFEVSGSHTYDRFGNYTVVVTIHDNFQSFTQTVNVNATITDRSIQAEWVEPHLPGGIGIINGVLAEVSDSNPNGLVSDLTAVIEWGDGSSTNGTITVDENGNIFVSGTKAYTAVGDYEVKVKITSAGGSTATATGTVRIANDPPVFAPVDDQSVDEGQSLSFDVAATDPNEGHTVRYQIIGPVPQFIVINHDTGRIDVAANASPGVYEIVVRAFDSGTPSQSSYLPLTVTVNNVNPTITLNSLLPAALETGKTIATTGFISDLPSSGPWNIKVDYGTGEGFVPVNYSSPTSFSIYKTYTAAGTYAVRTRVTDSSGGTSEIVSTITVSDPPLVTPVNTIATRDRLGRITQLQLFFDNELDAASAKLPSNYTLSLRPGRDGIFGTADDGPVLRFKKVTYDAASKSVTLTLAAPVNLRGRNQARVRVVGLRDTRDRAVDADRNGQAGGALLLSLTSTSVGFA